jgi:hypothetical protein
MPTSMHKELEAEMHFCRLSATISTKDKIRKHVSRKAGLHNSFFVCYKKKTINMAWTRLKNGSQQMAQASAGVDVVRKAGERKTDRWNRGCSGRQRSGRRTSDGQRRMATGNRKTSVTERNRYHTYVIACNPRWSSCSMTATGPKVRGFKHARRRWDL